MKSEFIKGSITGALGTVLKILLNLAIIPMLISYQGKANYGFYIFLVTFVELLLIMDLGLTTGLIQRVSSYYALEHYAKIQKILNNAQWLYLALSLLLFTLGSALSKTLPHFFNISQIKPEISITAFQLVIIEGSINLIASYFKSILKANSMYQWPNMIETFYALTIGVGIIGLVTFKFNLVALMFFRVLVSIICLIFCLLKTCQIEKLSIQFNFQLSLQELKELFTISFHAMIQRISVYLSYNIDDLVIARFLTLQDIATIGIVRKILSLPSQICYKILEGVFPIFARFSAQARQEASRFFFLRISAFINFIVLLMLFNLALIYSSIVEILGNHKIIPAETGLLAIVIAVYIWSGIIQMPASNYLFASGMHRFQTYTSLITAVANFGLSIFFVQKYGLIGVALGTLLAQTIQHQVLTIIVACKHLKLEYAEYLRAVYLDNLVPLVIQLLGLCVICYFMNVAHGSWVLMIVPILLLSLISASIWFQYSASSMEREYAYQHIFRPLYHKVKSKLKAIE
jgi:O-antigen/teichoic acid export membrane protein